MPTRSGSHGSRSVLEASSGMSPLPPPFNLPQTSFALMHRMLWADLHPAIKSRILWLFGQDFETLTDEDESYDYAAAKKAKQKVAKRLLLKLRKQEEEEGPGIAGALAEIKEQNERFVDMLQAQAAQIVSLSAKVNAVPAVAKLQAASAGGGARARRRRDARGRGERKAAVLRLIGLLVGGVMVRL